MTTAVLHPEIVLIQERLKACNRRAEAFAGLRADQLTWSVSRDRWSIAQCLDHLIVSNERYFPVLDRLNEDAFRPSFWERWSPFSKSIGRNMVAMLGPQVKRSFKAPKLFQPRTRQSRDPAILQRFLGHQQTLLEKLEKIRVADLTTCVITSPVAGLITLPLSDLLQVLAGHEERHLSQAERLPAHPQFPR